MRARSMKLPAASLAFALCLAACASSSTTSSGANTTPAEPPPPAMTEADAGAMTAPTAEVDAGATATTAEADAGAAMTGSDDAGATTTSSASTPPSGTPSRPATTTPDAAMIARGRAAHQRVCARCHEDGDSDGPRAGRNWTEARMRRQIRQGDSQMRPIPTSRLSDADLDALIAYYRTTRAVR